jgi:hypothetical protein
MPKLAFFRNRTMTDIEQNSDIYALYNNLKSFEDKYTLELSNLNTNVGLNAANMYTSLDSLEGNTFALISTNISSLLGNANISIQSELQELFSDIANAKSSAGGDANSIVQALTIDQQALQVLIGTNGALTISGSNNGTNSNIYYFIPDNLTNAGNVNSSGNVNYSGNV